MESSAGGTPLNQHITVEALGRGAEIQEGGRENLKLAMTQNGTFSPSFFFILNPSQTSKTPIECPGA